MPKLKIEGMSCDHCVRTVTKALEAMPGVTRVVEVDLGRGEATVEGNPDLRALARAIEAHGFVAHAGAEPSTKCGCRAVASAAVR